MEMDCLITAGETIMSKQYTNTPSVMCCHRQNGRFISLIRLAVNLKVVITQKLSRT